MTTEHETMWHALGPEATLRRLGVGEGGLSSLEAASRLARHGKNRLPEGRRVSTVGRFLRQFHNVLIYVLLAAAAGTASIQLWVDTAVILGVVVANALIGFLQEGKAEKALEAIRRMLSPRASTVRDGRRGSIPAEELVPGDLVLLAAGDRVPADLRLLQARSLQIDEAILTGESVPVEKEVAQVAAEAELGDRTSMAYSGTLVTYGQGKGIAVATGARSEIGRISTLLGEVEKLTTPLLRQVGQFGRWLSLVILLLSASTFAFGYLVRGYELIDIFLAAVSIAVAAIPEGLPAIMTITLAIGVQRMAARRAIIRRLPAVETLGAVTVIYSDKTGTLTRGEMAARSLLTAERSYELSGVGYEPAGSFAHDGREVDPEEEPLLFEALRAGALCNDAHVREGDDGTWMVEGDPTEGALLAAALKAKLDPKREEERLARIDVIPFDAGHRYMATLHRTEGGGGAVYLKGAPERVLQFCRSERRSGGDAPIDRRRWEERTSEVAGRGQRLLAIAAREAPAGLDRLGFGDVESELTLLAVVGILDPPREEAVAAVDDCRRAGIRVKMITGDHALTAGAIASDLGIGEGGSVVSGHELEAMDDEALVPLVAEVDVFARASPEHKLRLVMATQATGEVVAMTGDGVNDAPALKRADIGISMGVKGTEAAKEASEMVLADDNFATIAAAVKAGRTVYDNLQKSILFLLPTNGGQALTIVSAILLGLPLPLTPLQVLWVNMVTAVTLALALAFEPTEPGVMRRPPRSPSAPILSGLLAWRVAFVALLLVAGTFGHFLWLIERGVATEIARTSAINTLVAGQLFYLFNSRFIFDSSLSRGAIFGNRAALYAVGVLIVLQALFTYTPPAHLLFDTAPLPLPGWLGAIGFGVALFLLVELEKVWLRRRARRRGRPRARSGQEIR